MHRPGVDYWAHSRGPTQLPQPVHASTRPSVSASTSGPPSLSRTSTADFFIPSDDATLLSDRASSLGQRRAQRDPPLSPSYPPAASTEAAQRPTAAASAAALAEAAATASSLQRELASTQAALARTQQEQREEAERVARMQAVWAREKVELDNALQTLQASLAREHTLRTTAEQERQAALREGRQLRAALRALLNQPLALDGGSSTSGNTGGGSASNPTGASPTTASAGEHAVPLVLYQEARHLLLQCEHTFDELKMLQLRATDAAGLERLRRYDVPVLDGIPPAWPLETPQKGVNSQGDLKTAQDASSTHLLPSTPRAATPVASGRLLTAEETPTGPEVSALTTVSPDTPHSPSPADRSTASPSNHPNESHHLPLRPKDANNSKMDEEAGAGKVTSLAAARRSASTDTTGPRRMLLSPPVLSPPLEVHEIQPAPLPQQQQLEKGPCTSKENASQEGLPENNSTAGWSGPMHEFAAEDKRQEDARKSILRTAVNTTTTRATSTTAGLLDTSSTALTAPPPATLQPLRGAPLSEFERENIIRDTDALIRQLSRETVALAKSEGVRGSADLAALCRRRGLDYIDPGFLPVTETLGLSAGGCRGYDPVRGTSYLVQWCSRDVFAAQWRGKEGEVKDTAIPLLTHAGVDPNGLRCGRLGDTGVVAAFAALAEAAGAVASVLASNTSLSIAQGLYTVWLCVHGWWTRVHVDAYLPCLCESGNTADDVVLYGCRHAASTPDLWGPVCEKALAKVYGTYQALPHLRAEAVLGHLTGGPVECWDWWRRNSETALAEIEAAVNTSARGAGIVLLTTWAEPALRSTAVRRTINNNRTDSSTNLSSVTATSNNDNLDGESKRLAYERLGLLPGVSYRVLAVTDNADGEPMLLLRNWAKNSVEERGRGEGNEQIGKKGCHDASSLRSDDDLGLDGGVMLTFLSADNDAAPSISGAGRREQNAQPPASDDGCLWLHYTKEVLPLFEKCHACFDCRRFHDVRCPIRFVGSAPAVPTQLIRVRVRDSLPRRPPHTTTITAAAAADGEVAAPCPTRLWIGLHQPCGGEEAYASTSGAAVAWSLKVTLIGQEDAPSLYSGWEPRRGGTDGAAAPFSIKPARRSYVLSESFMGEPQALPAVWMYLELDPADLTTHRTRAEAGGADDNNNDDDDTVDGSGATVMEFFVVPQLELIRTFTADGVGGMEKRSRSHDLNNFQSPWRGRAHRRRDTFGDGKESETFFDDAASVWSQREADPALSATTNTTTTAIVAVLAEHRESVAVDVVEAPEELRAALYHDVVDRIDFSECVPRPQQPRRRPRDAVRGEAAADDAVSVTDVRCQLNGRCLSTFSW